MSDRAVFKYRTRSVLVFLCLSATLFTFRSFGAAPSNDFCTGAEVISGAGPFPWFTATNDLRDATTVGDPPRPTEECFGGDISRSVWYRFTPTASALYTISLKDNGTTVPDTVMEIYTSPAGCGGPFQPYGCNDDAGIGDLRQVPRSALTTNFNAGTTYFIVVWAVTTSSPAPGESLVQLTVTKPDVPANDRCLAAEVIPSSAGSGTTPYLTSIVDTYRATTNVDPPSPTCGAGYRSVWYKFNPSTSGGYTFSTCANTTQTKIYDTLLALYTASAGCGSTFTPIACSDNFCNASASATVNLSTGTDYYIVVWDQEPEAQSGETALQLQVLRQGPPIVTTLAASSLTLTGAVLNGTANPRGLLSRGYFQWGATTSYGNETATASIGNGTADAPFSRAVTGLTPGGTYHYRAAATNSLGVRFGNDMTFTLPVMISRVSKQTDGVHVEFTGAPGYTHKIQWSADLKTWTDLGNTVETSAGRYEYIDSGPTQLKRFYRIRL